VITWTVAKMKKKRNMKAIRNMGHTIVVVMKTNTVIQAMK
jgi:hypothetical protein